MTTRRHRDPWSDDPIIDWASPRVSLALLMPDNAPTLDLVAKHALEWLWETDSLGVIPTPLMEISSAAGLARPIDLYERAKLPARAHRAVKKYQGVVLGAFGRDDRQIFLDHSLKNFQLRMTMGHELAHALLPWQQRAFYVDGHSTLDPSTVDEFDRQANRFAEDLVFQLEWFIAEAAESKLSMANALLLAGSWQAPPLEAVRRYVSRNPKVCGLICLRADQHSGFRRPRISSAHESPTFRRQFGSLQECLRGPKERLFELYSELSRFVNDYPKTDLGEASIVLETERGLKAFLAEITIESDYLVVFIR
ncbi:MAG: ImmA/IrrE family metallo-endopeptidase [Actinomycetota bacterium]